jgi:hypothetical protein
VPKDSTDMTENENSERISPWGGRRGARGRTSGKGCHVFGSKSEIRVTTVTGSILFIMVLIGDNRLIYRTRFRYADTGVSETTLSNSPMADSTGSFVNWRMVHFQCGDFLPEGISLGVGGQPRRSGAWCYHHAIIFTGRPVFISTYSHNATNAM